MIFKYLLIALVGYWVFRRVFNIADAVKRNGHPAPKENIPSDKPKNKSNIDHSKGGQYIDYEEVE